ncbi:unnamed protein product [Anisakis simplex]|uniref:BRCT domain-containing protein n=1 Tax=Anisakis simplex TaxID=6269 RepID=A0A0M3K5P1_ANISI|nr:unnamed protein product [Anisakis simplex]
MAPRRRLQQKQGRGSSNEVDVPVSEASASGRAANKRVKSQQKSDVKKKTQPQQQGGEVTKSSKQRQCKPIASEEDVNTVNNLENNAESETVELKAAMKPNKKSKTVRFDVEHSETDDETSVLNQQPVKATALQAKSKSNQAVKKNTKTKSTTTKRKASNSTTKVEQEAPETAKVETDTKEEPVKKNTGAKVARTTKKRAVTKANSIIEQEEVISNNEQESDGKVEEVKKSAKTRGRRTRKNTSATTNSVVKEGIKKNARNQEKVSESGDEIKQSRKNARVKAAKTEPTVPELITNNKGKRAKMQTDVSEVVEKTKQQSKSTKKTTAKGRANAKKKTPEVDVRAMEVEESTAALASGAEDKADSVEESTKAELAITKKTTRPKRAVKPKESKADKVDPKGKVTKRQHQQQKSAKQARQTLAKALSVEKDNLMQQAQSKVEKKTMNKKTRQNLVQKDADERSDGNDSSEKTVETETMKKGKRTIKRAKVIVPNTDINVEDTSSVPRSKRLNLLGDCKSVDQQIEMQVTDSGEDKKEERQIEDSTINVTINDITPDDGRLQQLSKERELTPSELCSSKIDESCKEILSEEPLELHPIVPESSNYLAESAKISAEQGDGSLNSHFDVGQPSPKRPSVAESCDKESEESLDLHLDILESPKRGSDVLESCGKQRKESLDSHLDDSYESSHHDHMDVSQHTPSGAQPSNDTEMGGQNSHAEHEVPVDQEPTIVDETNPPSAIAAVDVSDTNRAKVSPNCSANSFANSVTDEKEMTDEGVHEGCEYNNEKILLPMDGGDAEVFEECCDVMTLPSNHSSLLVSRPSANVDNTGAVGDVLESVINKLEMPVTDVSTVNENQHISQNLDGIKGDAVDDLIAEQKHQLMDELQFDDENAIQQDDESAIQQDTKQMTKDNPDDFVRCENEQEIQKPATDLQTNKNSNSAKKRSAIPSSVSVRSRFELQHKKFWEKAPTIQEHVDRIKQLHSKHQSEIPNTFRRLAQSKASNSGSSGIPRRCTSESRSSVSALKTLAKSSIDRNTASQKAAAATSAVKSAAGGGALSTSAAGHQLSRLPCPQLNVKSLTRQRAKEERLMNRSVQRPSPLSRSEPRLSKRLERLATPKKLARPSTSARRQGEQDKIASTSGGMHRGLQSYVDTTAMNDKQYADAMKRGMIKPLNTSFSLR